MARGRKILGGNKLEIPETTKTIINNFNDFLIENVLKSVIDNKRCVKDREMYKGAEGYMVKVKFTASNGSVKLLYSITKNKENIKKVDKEFKSVDDIKKEIYL